MKVKVRFKKESRYEKLNETFDNITEIHFNYANPLGQVRIAFESDMEGTGYSYNFADIAEFIVEKL